MTSHASPRPGLAFSHETVAAEGEVLVGQGLLLFLAVADAGRAVQQAPALFLPGEPGEFVAAGVVGRDELLLAMQDRRIGRVGVGLLRISCGRCNTASRPRRIELQEPGGDCS